MSECVRGCTLRGQHKDDCPGNACPGCLPRPATYGLMCEADSSRLWDWLIDVPVLYAELVDDELLEPAAGGSTPGKPRKRDASPAPGRVAVMAERDQRKNGDDYQGTLGDLHFWARRVRRERGLTAHRGNGDAPTVEGEAGLLRSHLDHVCGQPWALECYVAVERAFFRLGNLTYSRHPGEKANASCFDCGGDLVRRWRELSPCECGPKPGYPDVPAYPGRRPGVDYQAAVQAWVAVRNRLVGDWETASADWVEGHRACDQGGLTDGYTCRGCRRAYDVASYWLAVTARYQAEKQKLEEAS